MASIKPSDPVVQANLPKIREILLDDNVRTWFIATSQLKNLILRGDPSVTKIPEFFKTPLLEGKGLLIQKRLVLSYLNGTLDKDNSFVFDNGEIMITNQNETSGDGVKREVYNIRKDILGIK